MVCGRGFLTLSVLLIRGSCSDETDAGNDEGADRRGDHNHDAAPVKTNAPASLPAQFFACEKFSVLAGTPALPESVKNTGYGMDPAPESEPFTWLHSHALCQNSSPAFLAGLPGVCYLFYPFPVRNALRSSERCA